MKFKKAIAIMSVAVLSLGLLSACSNKPVADIQMGVLQGPTGIGAAQLMAQNDANQTLNNYDFTITSAPTDLVSKITSGELDIAAMPTNLAANLYTKSDSSIQIIALNTLGVLYILENGETVQNFSDLKGKTLYATGQAANPEYTLNFLLRENGLEPNVDVTIEYLDGNEIVAKMAANTINLCMLPVPYATTVLANNQNVRQAIDITEQWDATVTDDSVLTMGCLVARRDFINENKDAISTFLQEYKNSIDYVLNNQSEAAQMVVDYGIVGSVSIAEQAIPKSNLVCITGDDIKPAIDGYFRVLFNANPASIGGEMPADGIYYAN